MQSANLGKHIGIYFRVTNINAPRYLVCTMKKQINIDELEPKAKMYKVGVGGSMFVQVMPNGSKYWRLSYRHEGKQKTLAVGTYPELSLDDAMKERDKAKELIKSGIDPSQHKRLLQNERIIHNRVAPTETSPPSMGFKLAFEGENFVLEKDGQKISLTDKEAKAVFSFLDSTINNEVTI